MRFPALSSSCLLLIALPVARLPAGEPASPAPRSFTLESALHEALARSPAVQVRAAEIDRREGVREQASGEFDWIASAAATRTRERTPAVDPLGGDAVTRTDTTAYSVAATRRLRNGVIVQPSVEVGIPERASPPAPTFGASNLNLQIIVPLLRGLGSGSTAAAEAAARGDVEVARLLHRHSLARQALDTATAYWSARAAQAALVVRRDDQARAQKLHDGIRVLVDTRVFAPNLLLQSEANLRQKSTSTQDAELVALDALFTLARVIGYDPAVVARPPVPDQALPGDVPAAPALDTEEARPEWIARALRQRTDFLAARQSEVPLRILSRQAELDLKPRVDLSVRGGYAGLNSGSDLLAPLSQRLTGLNGEVGLVWDWPVQNTYQRGLLRERRAAERQAQLSTEQARTGVAAEVCSALAEVRLRAETMRNAGATTGIARQAVDQEQRRLQAGEATVLDVINLENLLSSARLSHIESQAGYVIAVARLRFALGEIFGPEAADKSFPLADLTQPPLP